MPWHSVVCTSPEFACSACHLWVFAFMNLAGITFWVEAPDECGLFLEIFAESDVAVSVKISQKYNIGRYSKHHLIV